MSESTEQKIHFVVVRIRGKIGVRKSIKETLGYLRLHKANHAVLIDDRKTYKGMLQKVKDYVTWGKIDQPTLYQMLKKRGRLIGNLPLDDNYIKKYTKYNSIEEFSNALLNSEIEIKDIPNLKPVFRLHPPRKGFKHSKKRPFRDFGELGNRDTEINSLLIRMI